MRFLKQSTSVDLPIGPFLDETDGKTAETGLTLTQPDIRLKKNGGAWAQKNAAQTLSHEENGWYEVTLDATDTGTLGCLQVAVHESGALPVWHEFMVLPAMIYDSLVAGTDVLDASVTQWTGTAVASPDTAGYPKVTIKSGTGTGEVSLSSGLVTLAATGLDNVVTAEPSSPPAFGGTLKGAISWLLALGRNKMTQNSTTTLVRNDADSGTIGTSTVSDDGTTFTRGKFS